MNQNDINKVILKYMMMHENDMNGEIIVNIITYQ